MSSINMDLTEDVPLLGVLLPEEDCVGVGDGEEIGGAVIEDTSPGVGEGE